MKAILKTIYGPPEVLQFQEVEKPSPTENQVLVKVHAASVNALEWRPFTLPPLFIRLLGWLRKPKDPQLGTDVAGVVEAVGDSVTRFKPGDEVFGGARGSFAEYALAREKNLTLKPAQVSFAQAAAVPVAALTALQAIRYAGGLRPRDQVLIQGASGGVGMFAVQLAKASGAEVTAVVSTRNLEMMRALGADQVIDYSKADFTKNGKPYDVILAINGYHSLAAYRRALKPQGVYVCAGGDLAQIIQALLFGRWFSQKGGRTMGIMSIAKINQDDLTTLGELLHAGKIAPVIDRQYRLSQTAAAIRHVMDVHAQGKVVIEVFKAQAS